MYRQTGDPPVLFACPADHMVPGLIVVGRVVVNAAVFTFTSAIPSPRHSLEIPLRDVASLHPCSVASFATNGIELATHSRHVFRFLVPDPALAARELTAILATHGRGPIYR